MKALNEFLNEGKITVYRGKGKNYGTGKNAGFYGYHSPFGDLIDAQHGMGCKTGFQVGIANYNAIYSSFAAVPIFLAWIYFSWLTVMFGAEFTYALTHAKHYRQILLHDLNSTRSREILALRAVAHIVLRWKTGTPPTTRELSDTLEVPSGPLGKVLAPLVEAGILSEGGNLAQPSWLPGRSPDTTYVADVLEALRGDGPEVSLDHKLDHEVTSVYDELRRVEREDSHNLDLASLAGLGHQTKSK